MAAAGVPVGVRLPLLSPPPLPSPLPLLPRTLPLLLLLTHHNSCSWIDDSVSFYFEKSGP